MNIKRLLVALGLSALLLSSCSVNDNAGDQGDEPASSEVDTSRDGMYLTFFASNFVIRDKYKMTYKDGVYSINTYLKKDQAIQIKELKGKRETLYPKDDNIKYLTNCNSAIDQRYLIIECKNFVERYEPNEKGFLIVNRNGTYKISLTSEGIMTEAIDVKEIYIKMNGKEYHSGYRGTEEPDCYYNIYEINEEVTGLQGRYGTLPAGTTIEFCCEDEDINISTLIRTEELQFPYSINGNTITSLVDVKYFTAVSLTVAEEYYYPQLCNDPYVPLINGVFNPFYVCYWDAVSGSNYVRLKPGDTLEIDNGRRNSKMHIYDKDTGDLIGDSITNNTDEYVRYYYDVNWDEFEDNKVYVKKWLNMERTITVEIDSSASAYEGELLYVWSCVKDETHALRATTTCFVEDGKVAILEDADCYAIGVFNKNVAPFNDPVLINRKDKYSKEESRIFTRMPNNKITIYLTPEEKIFGVRDSEVMPSANHVTFNKTTELDYFSNSGSVYVWYWSPGVNGEWLPVSFTVGADSATVDIPIDATGFLVAKYDTEVTNPSWNYPLPDYQTKDYELSGYGGEFDLVLISF